MAILGDCDFDDSGICRKCGLPAPEIHGRVCLGIRAPKPVPISEWEIVPNYFCRACGDPARANPADGKRWGCAKCNGDSGGLELHFSRVDSAFLSSTVAALI
jgi:hypothetical protein